MMSSRNNSFLITAGILGLLVIALLASVLFDNLVAFWIGMAASILFVLYILMSFNKKLMQYENQMLKGKTQLEALIRSIGDAAVVVDMERKVLQLNSAAEKLTGWTDGDAFNRPIAEVVGTADLTDPILVASNLGDACNFEDPVVLKSADQKKSYLVQSAVPIRDKNGRAYRVVLIFKEQLEEKPGRVPDSFEKKYQMLFKSMLNGYALVEMIFQNGKAYDYRFIDMNPSYEEMTGYKKEECVGKTAREVLPYMEDFWTEIYGHVAVTGTPARFQQYSVYLGKYFEVYVTRTAYNQIAVCLLDNTEHKRTEDSLLVSEKKARFKLDSILSPKGDIKNLEFSEILDIQEIGPLMDDFYTITQVPAAITDNNGKILLSNGMQDICINFHWNNDESKCNCPLSAGQRIVASNSERYELRRCQNGLWNLSVPIVVDERQPGFLIICQFIMEEEEYPEGRFQKQAQQYGYDLQQYLIALEKVPRIKRGALKTAISFYVQFAESLSIMSMRNLQLARSYMQAENTKMLLKSSIEGSKEITMVMVDRDYRYLFFNQAHRDAMKLLYGQDAQIEKSIFENITSEEDKRRIKDDYERALAGESHYIIREYGVSDKKFLESFFSPIYNNQHEVIGATAFSRDISERRHMEMAIAASEARHMAMLANISDAIMILDENACCRYVSPNASEKFGRIFALGEKVIELRYIHSADRKRAQEEFDSMVKNPQGKITMELRFIGKDAKFHYIDVTGVNLMYDPNIRGILINFHDITDKKRKEKEIVYLTEHSSLTGLYNRRFFDDQIKKLDINESLPLSVIVGDINGLKMINDALGHDAGDRMIVEISQILKSCIRKGDVLARTGGDEFSILLPKTTSEQSFGLIKRIHAKCREHKSNSDVYYLSISMGFATKTSDNELIGVKIKEAEDNMYKHKLLEHKSLHSSVISSIKTTMMEKDFQTEEHAERLALLSNALGKALNLSTEQMDELELLSTLHDIGKIVVEDRILKKQSPLTGMEWDEMKKHPEVGYRIAMASPELISIAEFILTHHERWDGTGYPQGIAGEDIPLLSRVLAVTDSYDAMTQDRPYRKAMTREAAVAEIQKNAGKQFDPNIVQIFVKDILLNLDD
ncbi:MAG: HD domain-containing phosphohydrolase [Eubacteriales bacterium]